MKRLFLFVALLSVCLTGLLVAQTQTYKDGINSYNEAFMAFTEGDEKGEKKALENAYTIFKSLASQNNEALLMYYLLAHKLEKDFTLPNKLNHYVKTGYPKYPAVDSIPFTGADKTFVLDNLRKLADRNREKALTLLKKAEKDVNNEGYGDALDNLMEAEKLWNVEGLNEKKNKYSTLKKEKESAQLVNRVKGLEAKGLYQDAIDALDAGKGVLETSQMASLKGEIKNNWYKKVIGEAKIERKNKHYGLAIAKCDEAYSIVPNKEALKLKRKYERKIKGVKKGGFALFADLGYAGTLGLDSHSYSWSGNSFTGFNINDHGSLSSELVKENEDELKISYGFSGGLAYMFSDSFGVSLSASPFLKQEFDVFSDYSFTVSWGSDSVTDSRDYTDYGSISVVPINFNLLVALQMSSSAWLNVYAGPTLYLAKIDLSTHIGMGGYWLLNSGNSEWDWFPFEYRIEKSETIFGGNCGAELEFKAGNGIGLYIGGQYFFTSKKEYEWELVDKRYDGEWDNVYISRPYNISPRPSYKSKVNMSTFKINLGFKVYL